MLKSNGKIIKAFWRPQDNEQYYAIHLKCPGYYTLYLLLHQ